MRTRRLVSAMFVAGVVAVASAAPAVAQPSPTGGEMSRAYLAVVCPANAKMQRWDSTIAATVAGTASVEQGRRAAASWASYNPRFARDLRALARVMRPDVAAAVKAIARQVSDETPYLRDLALIPNRPVSFARYVMRLYSFQDAQPDAGNEVRSLLGLPLDGWCPAG